ncbi:MAG TPA: 23S rRNA (pseudouridine(1915)-N(3))-methyltransferase RlmH [Phnomibacter sp.]|nr:23S rRNA (pseudouridine(1915)-N(3))-methyltransferase RlmH [Phnomibacter sp.]
MKLIFWSIGGKHDANLAKAIEDYSGRINHYYSCEWKLIAVPKNAASLTLDAQKDAESNLLLQSLDPVDYVILLDERGKMLSSPELAGIVEQRAINGAKKIHIVIGGAFGVNDAVRKRADLVWQLSKLVFPHQLVRLMLVEQVYRACTIIRGEKYHHV